MGWLDRIHSVITATGGALEAPVGFVNDVAKAIPELGSLDLPGFTHDVYHAFLDASGKEISSLVGPQGITGSAVGALPDWARQGGNTVIKPLETGMDLAYHDLVGKPLSTLATAATIAKQDGVGELFKPKTLSESWDIAEHRSPGQSLALAFLTSDIFDPAQVKKAQGTDWYNVISGVTDAAARTFLDPTALALGEVTALARGARLAEENAHLFGALKVGGLERLTESGAVDTWVNHVVKTAAEYGDGAPSALKRQFFARHMAGNEISDLLIHAARNPEGTFGVASGEDAVRRVTRILMGSNGELEALRAVRPELAGRIDRLATRPAELKALSLNGFELANSPDRLANIDRELNVLHSQAAISERLDNAATEMHMLPRPDGIGAMRGRFTLGDFYQSSLFAKPLHIGQLEPHRWVHLDDPRGDLSIMRQLAKTELPLDEQLAWHAKYMAAPDVGTKATIATRAEEAGVASIIYQAAKIDLATQSYEEIARGIARLTGVDPADAAKAAQRYEQAGSTAGLEGADLTAAQAHAKTLSKEAFAREQFQPILDEMSRGRDATKVHIQSMKYDGEDRALITFDDENGVTQKISVPLFESQLPNLHPMVDMSKVRKAVSPIEKALARNPLHGVAPEYLERFNHLWKPAVLLRPGFMFRFLTDETLRSMSRIGVLATSKNIALGARGQASEWAAATKKALKIDPLMSHEQIAAKVADWVDGDAAAMRDLAKAAVAKNTPKDVFVKDLAEHAGLGRSEEALLMHPVRKVVGMDPVFVNGHEFGGAFGAPGDMSNIGRKLIQAREALGSLIDADQGRFMEHLMQSGPWYSLDPIKDATVYGPAWEHAVNNQIGKSDLGNKLLEWMQSPAKALARRGVEPLTRDEIIAKGVDWLQHDERGIALAKKIPQRSNLDEWVTNAHDHIDAYLPTDELKAAAWQGTATHDMLARAVPDAAARPIIHGGVTAEAMGTGPIGQWWRNVVDKGMENMVGKPSNVLIRQPFFDHNYQAELARQVGLKTGEVQQPLAQRILHFGQGESTHAAGGPIELSTADMRQMELRARRYAVGQTKDLFHDFSEEYSFAKALGFLSPFANAYGQIMSRWAGVAVDNPGFVRRLQIVWRSPDRAGLVTDGQGNVLDEHGKIVTPAMHSGHKVGDDAADGQRLVHIHLPDWAKDVPGLQGRSLTFGKADLNLLVHGLPPVGPIVQVAVNEIAKQRPEMEDALKWALPYGVTRNPLEIIEPTVLRRIITLYQGENSRDFAYTTMRIYNDKLVDYYKHGSVGPKPTYEDAKNDSSNYWKLRLFTSFVLPTSPQLSSPYQPYIDALQARRDLDAKLTPQQRQLASYKTPDEWFLDTFGAEYFPLVASLSKSIDGIAPTLEGQKLHEDHAALLAKHPELGPLLSGAEGAGTFSRAVYEAQFDQNIGPGTAQKEREIEPFASFKTKASTQLGWTEFGRMMDTLDSILHQRQLTSYTVKGASDLMAAKQAYIAFLAQDPHYDGWFQDYSSTDNSKWDQRIAGFTDAVKDKKLMDRPEFQGLKQYIDARREVRAVLEGAQSHTLSAKANAGIANAWEAYTQFLAEQNPAFGALFHRYLQNDPVTSTPISALAESGQLTPTGVA